jgi:hypothetical protein
MLTRYRRPGGFIQLLTLIETFGPQKREKFLEMIDLEDKAWGRAIREKSLTIERFFDWPEQAIAEVARALPVKNLACAIKGINAVNIAKIRKFMSTAELRRLDDEVSMLKVTPDEVNATFVKIIELVRKMIKSGELRLDKIDSTLIISEAMEFQLSHSEPSAQINEKPSASASTMTFDNLESGDGEPKSTDELVGLRKNLAVMTKENKSLKDELKILREKLEQIRKIA